MDVALVASLVSPIQDAEANGPHALIRDLANGLGERGHRVTVYAAAGSSLPGLRLVEIPVTAQVRAARVLTGVPAATEANAAVRDAFDRLFAAIRRAGHDVISQHAFDAEALELCEGLPVLHTLHLPPMVPAVTAAARVTRSRLATVSAAAARAWARAGVHGVAILTNGVPDRGEPPGALPEPVALIAGRISPEKGTGIAIEASLAAGLRPWVVGDPYDRDYFRREVRPLLADAEYFGAVTRAELSALMARAAVLVMPIDWEEPFGLVAAEAQMAGCPVVGYRRGALPEVVEEGVSGILVPPGDEPRLIAGIRGAQALDRESVRASALRRLHVRHTVDAYEVALGRIGHALETVA